MKRLALAPLLIAAALAASPIADAQNRSAQATSYQQNCAHTGSVVMPELHTPLVVRWSVNLGAGHSMSYPLIAAGRVFVTAKTGASYGTKLYAFDAATGDALWGPIALSGTYYWSGLAYSQSTVYVINFDGLLRAFDAATGSLLWSTQMPGQYAFSSPPTIVNGVLYTGGAGIGGTVYAVNATTGAVLWTQSVENGDDSSPAVTTDGVFVSYSCPNVYKLDPASGAVLWHNNPNCTGGGGKTPLLYGGKLYARDSSRNTVFDAGTGAVIGTFDSRTIPAVRGSTGYFMPRNGSSSYLVLRAVDLDTNAVLWTFSGDGQLRSAPFVVNGTVFVGSATGKLFAVDAVTGAEVWAGAVGAPIPGVDEQNVSQPLTGFAAGNGILVVPTDSLLVAYESAAGR